MVMTKAVPALRELVHQDSPTDAAGDDDGDFPLPPSKNGIKPAHARTLDTADNVRVTSIIQPDTDFEINEDGEPHQRRCPLYKEDVHRGSYLC
ncbi:hypothetical protein F2Q68_00020720 [Brassica cretica]|uniref:Uncharacterized protein n=1 Tax=Brassica cretica TaxID=69181 RepID=A0A8S9FPX6_BRACR|nr:hypothetical protein F2Q68_00020720 [Brassica cretica]